MGGTGPSPHAYRSQLLLRLPVQNGEGEQHLQRAPAQVMVLWLERAQGDTRGEGLGVCVGLGCGADAVPAGSGMGTTSPS